MNIALAARKALIATVIVPAIALTAVSVESFTGLSGAKAQQAPGAGSNNGGGNNGGGNSGRGGNNGGGNNGGGANNGGGSRGENPYLMIRHGNCVPGVATHFVPCRPPRRPRPVLETAEQRDCSCQVHYRVVGGRRIAVKDCYFEVNNEIRYCRKDQISLR